MAPKRKRATDEAAATAAATRAPRRSARGKGAGSAEATDASPQVDEDVYMEDPQPKKPKRAAAAKTSKATKASTARKTAAETTGSNHRAEGDSGNSADDDALRAANVNNASSTSVGSSTKPAKAVKGRKPAAEADEPYSAARATVLFERYADQDDPSVIGAEGLERLCNDAEISLEGSLPLILAWQFGASEMARLSKEEWEKGTSRLQVSSLSALSAALHDLEDLLILDKPPLKPPGNTASKKKPEPYWRVHYYQYATTKAKAFSELYTFCFLLAKPEQARNIDMETASAFWSVLVLPRYSLMQDILDFIQEKGTYKGVNKDLWSMVLEFCQSVSPTLENYEADGAWPTMLDEFVTWKKANMPVDAEEK